MTTLEVKVTVIDRPLHSFGSIYPIQLEAYLFNPTFYGRSHSKGLKQGALHVHQTKTKQFITKLFAQPIDSNVIFSICMIYPRKSCMYLFSVNKRRSKYTGDSFLQIGKKSPFFWKENSNFKMWEKIDLDQNRLWQSRPYTMPS